nr:hypothetical protein GCM10020063_009650 [Dactylosporangium thailandense]
MTHPTPDRQPTPGNAIPGPSPTARPAPPIPPDGPSAANALPILPAGPTAVLVPFDVGHQRRMPAGQRVEIPHLPPALRPPSTAARRPPVQNRRRVLLAGAVAVVAVLAIAAITIARTTSGPSPRDVVADYFATLTARDSTNLPPGRCDNNPLCAPAALDAGYQPPHDVTIGDDTGTNDLRHVPVTYTIAGQPDTTVIDLRGTRTGMFTNRTWTIINPPGAQLTIPDHTPAPITIAAARLPTPKLGEQATLWAPPGQYTLTRPATPVLEAGQASITVTSGPPPTITIPNVLKPAAVDTAQQIIHDRIDACAAKPAFAPTVGAPGHTWNSCPITYPERYTITNDPTWTINTYPQLHLEPADDGTITVTTTTPGQATIRYRWTDHLAEPRTWTDATDTIDVTVTGRITAASGTPEWQPA